MRTVFMAAAAIILALPAFPGEANDIFGKVEDHYADNNGVKIHYVTIGEGPVILFVHGFPDFWYSWRNQMAGLKDRYTCVAMDGRGYNLSDKPKGVENYDIKLLVSDVDAVRKDLGVEKIILVGHDWGGFIAWNYTFTHQANVDKLIILNLPHPRGFTRELANNEEQRANSQYARNFQQPDAHKNFTAEGLARGMIQRDPEAGKHYLDAFQKSDMEGMLNYYKANYPREPYEEWTNFPVVTCPVLQFHGLKDTALHHHGLNQTWEWLGKDWTLVTTPDSGHFIQWEAPDLVTTTMRWWLDIRK